MDERQFIFEDQEAFAKLSGDFNLMHMDIAMARRTMLGNVVVHGIHSLLWAMDNWCKKRKKLMQLTTLRVEFGQAVKLDEVITLHVSKDEDNYIEFMLQSKSVTVATVSMSVVERLKADFNHVDDKKFSACASENLMPDKFVGISQNLRITSNRELATKLFSDLTRVFPYDQIALILSTTRFVGMHCPGMYSVFSSLDLSFQEKEPIGINAQFTVERYDPRFSMLKIRLASSGVDGIVTAFYRPPQKQAGFPELSRAVEANEFHDQKALVVGGSRGIGEICAKLLAAGGADVVVSYNRGEADGIRVVEEIRRGGGSARLLKLDVLNITDDLGRQLRDGWRITHLYYFATPPIFVAQRGNFSYKLFRKFCDCYLGALLELISALEATGATLSQLFYPSSVAIDELPLNMGEYSVAKAAGEQMVRFLEKAKPELSVHTPRLPRISTDQTLSIVPVRNEDPSLLVLPVLRTMTEVDAEEQQRTLRE